MPIVGLIGIAVVIGYLLLRRVRLDGPNLLIAVGGCLVILLVCLNSAAVVHLAHQFFHLIGMVR